MNTAPLPSIAVITPSFRQARFIAETIESVRAQNYPALEHWIIDAESNDGTAEVVARYASPQLHWVSEPDRNQTDAINKGMRRSTAEILGWLNSDDRYLPGALQAVGEAFRDNPDAAVVYGGGVKINRAGVVVKEVPAPAYDRQALRNRFYVIQPSMFFRRSLFDRLGGLNVEANYAMDWELMLRFPPDVRPVIIPQMLSQLRCYVSTKTVQGGWRRMQEIGRLGREFHGVLDHNFLSWQGRELVSRISHPGLYKLGQRVVDGLCDKLFGWDGYMVRGWPQDEPPEIETD